MTKLDKLSQEEMDNVIYDARFGDLESLTEIFTNEVETSVIPTIKDAYTFSTPFHMAAANGHLEVLKYLLSLIPDVEEKKKLLNLENDCGNTALHWASLNGHLEIVQLLCDNGADPFIRNKYGHDSFFEASNNEQEKVDDYLLEKFGNIVEEEIDNEEGDEDENTEEGSKDNTEVKFSEGTEIKNVTEEDAKAVEELRKQAENISL